MFISNNRTSFHLWGKKNLVKHREVSKYNETDCRICCHCSVNLLVLLFAAKEVSGYDMIHFREKKGF